MKPGLLALAAVAMMLGTTPEPEPERPPPPPPVPPRASRDAAGGGRAAPFCSCAGPCDCRQLFERSVQRQEAGLRRDNRPVVNTSREQARRMRQRAKLCGK